MFGSENVRQETISGAEGKKIGGYVTDWKGGRLDAGAPGCEVVAQVARDRENSDKTIIGEGLRSSDFPAMAVAKPTIYRLAIQWRGKR
jgi:hypothetical protein